MNSESLLKDLLIQKDESTILDFKREITLFTDKDKNEFAKDVSAFANTRGGHIVYGKEDPGQGGRIVGIKPETFDGARVQQIISSKCYPPVNFEAELVQFQGLWFGLLTIPPSSLKPHEIQITRDVWVRRGSTTDKATDRERTLMHRETERKTKTSEAQSQEAASDKYRGKALAMACVTLFLVFFLPLRLVAFWILGRGLDNWINVETFVFVVGFVVISAIGGYFFEPSFSNLLLRAAHRLAIPCLLSCAVFVFSIVILNLSIFLYPEQVRAFFQMPWQNFLVLSALLLPVMLMIVVLSHYPLAQYYSALRDDKYVPDLKIETRQLIQNFKHNVKTLQSRFPAVVILAIVVFSSLIVPMDKGFVLFTPRVSNEKELLSSIMEAQRGFEKVAFISATRGPGNNVSAAYHYYALMNTTYNIALPTFWRLLSSVYVDNPSNTSFVMGQYYPSRPSATDTWKLYVAAPDNVTYDPILKQTPTYETKVTGLIFDFGNFTGNNFLIATLTYWQEIAPLDKVKIDYGNLTFADLGNGTWTETHTIMITNNSNDTLFIPAMDYDRFNFDYVIRNSTNAYLNGSLISWAELVWQTRLSLHIWVQPQTMSNVTISFQTTRNPE
jgi:hypothetical protein